VFFCLATAAGLLWLAVASLTINTSTNDMLDAELPFRQAEIAVESAFPLLFDSLTVVLEGPDGQAAEAGAAALAAALRQQPEAVHEVFQPQGGDFFRRNGLLYLEPAELQALADRLAGAQPLLAALQGDPSLRGLAGLLGEAIAAEAAGQPPPSSTPCRTRTRPSASRRCAWAAARAWR
jgi:hypothetical protein